MKTKFYLLCILVLFIVTGCIKESDKDSRVISLTPTEEEIFATQTTTPYETVVLPTISVTPTWTLKPKLSQAEVDEKVMEFYENNGDRELPCWWGIMPGETTLEEVYETYAPLGEVYLEEYDGKPWILLFITMPEKISGGSARAAWIYLEIENNYIIGLTGINYDSQLYSDYALSDYLIEFGEPSHVYVNISRELIFFTLLYPDIGLKFSLWGVPNELLNATEFVACPQTASNSDIRTWDPIENRIEEIIENEVFYEWPYIFHLEEVTDMSITDFYNIYLDPNTSYCVNGKFIP